MKNDWKSILKTILQKHIDIEEVETIVIDINTSLKNSSLLKPIDIITLPTYISTYVVGFIAIDLKRKVLYHCVDDLKSGGSKVSRKFELTDEDMELLKKEKWPYDSHNEIHYIRETPSYQFYLGKN